MSDFDKEAEREKLRKKFADDDEKRADTRRMSELLLKGATMTNKHCSQCSDPLFRYDGQTFCPSCQAQGSAVQAETDAVDTQSADPTETQPTVSEEQPQTNAESHPQSNSGQRPSSTGSPAATDTRVSDPNQSTGSQSSVPTSSRSEREKTQSAVEGADRGTAPAGDLTAARQSLTRTLTRFARQAEQTDDPRRARELLAAAREAAATLAALE